MQESVNVQAARIAPTNYGNFEDVEWQLREVEKGLDSAACWLEVTMAAEPVIEQMRQSITDWIMAEGEQICLDLEAVKAYELANPLGMSADGLLRYWKKVKMAG